MIFFRYQILFFDQFLHFVQLLVKKSGVGAGHIENLIYYVSVVESNTVSDKMLLEISDKVDHFYKEAKAN